MRSLTVSDNIWTGMNVSLYTLAIVMGSFRLVHRYRTKLYYWDDLGVAGCLICNVMIFSVLCTLNGELLNSYSNSQLWTWFLWFCLPTVQWTSRLSIASTIFRLIQFDIWRKRLTIAVTVAFTLAWMLIILNYLLECQLNTLPQRNCSGNVVRILAITSFAVDMFADACLVYIPLHLLRNLRLPRGRRLMVRVVFSVSGISAVATIVNLISDCYEGPNEELLELLSCMLKAPVALIACSLIVVIPCIHRLVRKEEEGWMISILINIDVSDAAPAASHAVSLPEPVAVRDPATQSFPTLPLPSLHRSLLERGHFHSWPQRDRIGDKSAMLA